MDFQQYRVWSRHVLRNPKAKAATQQHTRWAGMASWFCLGSHAENLGTMANGLRTYMSYRNWAFGRSIMEICTKPWLQSTIIASVPAHCLACGWGSPLGDTTVTSMEQWS